MSMIRILLSFLAICFWQLAASAQAPAQAAEEFDGPYAGWADIRQQFGARGDGKTDDTRAFQKAIDGLSCPPNGYKTGNGAYMVLYLPAGTYCLSSTLLLKGKIGVSIIGEDPDRTSIKWTGDGNDTILWADGSAYFKIARITWDANGRKGMQGIGIHWKDRWQDAHSSSFAALNIEISDCYFTGAFNTGISGGTTGVNGTTGANDSEIAIRRCRFSNCTTAGIQITGYNALDYWIWDCQFRDCQFGVDCAYGNYHVYHSFFSGSSYADVHHSNGYYTSVRACYSERPKRFSSDEGMSSNPFKRIFQDNTVIDPLQAPIIYTHTGKLSLWGNRFSRQSDTTQFKYNVFYGSWSGGNYEVLSLHNLYTHRPVFQFGTVGVKKIYSLGDVIRPNFRLRDEAAAFVQRMDPLPPRRTRPIFEVPAGASAAGIQAILDKAAKMRGQRPVVHFPLGTWYLDKPLLVAAGADMQITGDGLVYASVLVLKSGSAPAATAASHASAASAASAAPAATAGPAFLVMGPSSVRISDVQIINQPGPKPSAAIVFENVDQPGSQAHLDQVYSQADTSLCVNDLNWLYVEKDNSFFSAGNYISGGPLVRQNKGTARVACYGGQFARLTVEHNARFLARDCWWEGPDRIPLDLSGSGSVTIDGAMIAPAAQDSGTTIRIGKFDGHIALLNMYLQGGLSVNPDNPGLNLLAWNILFYFKLDVLDFLRAAPVSYKGAFAGLNAQCFRPKDPACNNFFLIADKFPNVRDKLAYLDVETAQDRTAEPLPYKLLPAGVTNISLSRVAFGAMNKAIEFR